jgi:hypothetical protein
MAFASFMAQYWGIGSTFGSLFLWNKILFSHSSAFKITLLASYAIFSFILSGYHELFFWVKNLESFIRCIKNVLFLVQICRFCEVWVTCFEKYDNIWIRNVI